MSNPIEAVLSYSKSIKLLYVEDNEEARVFTMELLSRFFDNIVVACNGEEGLKIFEEKDVDLVITDINMPKMGGIEMSSRIRKLDKNIPIILLSAHNEEAFKESAYNVGADEYLAKPLNISEFIDVLNRLFHSKSLNKDLEKNYE